MDLFLIIALGALKPSTWEMFAYGLVIAVVLALILMLFVARLYPWGVDDGRGSLMDER
jgi:fumarate reductase subunit D